MSERMTDDTPMSYEQAMAIKRVAADATGVVAYLTAGDEGEGKANFARLWDVWVEHARAAHGNRPSYGEHKRAQFKILLTGWFRALADELEKPAAEAE